VKLLRMKHRKYAVPVLLTLVGSVALVAGHADAHTRTYSATCYGAALSGSQYDAAQTNTAYIYIDGVSQTAGELGGEDFGTTLFQGVPIPQDGVTHSVRFVIAIAEVDNPAWELDVTVTVGPCGTPPTTTTTVAPTTTTTVAPTTTTTVAPTTTTTTTTTVEPTTTTTTTTTVEPTTTTTVVVPPPPPFTTTTVPATTTTGVSQSTEVATTTTTTVAPTTTTTLPCVDVLPPPNADGSLDGQVLCTPTPTPRLPDTR
jgi:hypothetical protein